MNNSSKSGLSHAIQERLVIPQSRLALFPDQGIATIATGWSRSVTGATYSSSDTFWQFISNPVAMVASVMQNIATAVQGVFGSTDGLQNDEILVDILFRTPNGREQIYNIPMHLNNIDSSKKTMVLKELQAGNSLTVKLTFDGGKISECTPISYKFESPINEHVIDQINRAALTGSAPNAGDLTDPTSPVSAIYTNSKVASTSKTFLCDRHDPLIGFSTFINEGCQLSGIDPCLIAGIMLAESSGNPKAHSTADAKGLMQLEQAAYTDSLARVKALLAAAGSNLILTENITDPRTNTYLGANYIKFCIDQFGGNVFEAIQAYNVGPTQMKKFTNKNITRVPASYSQDGYDYLPKVVTRWYKYEAISAKISISLIGQKKELTHTDATAHTNQTSHVALSGGTGVV